jgi:cobalt/nickel transport protein
MKQVFKASLALAYLALITTSSQAHYNMLLPQAASAKKGESIVFVYQWGHPFEHQLFDAPAPEQVLVVAPDGSRMELTMRLEKVSLGESNKATAYRFAFTPEQRGDYLFILKSAPIWIAEDAEFLQDIAKVIVHVQVQKGWDAAAGMPFEITPLTRPYGLQPGMVFQAQVEAQASKADKKPLAGALVEIEHYHPTVPATLPADEHITRTTKADPNGVATCTLTEPGWWCLTAARDGGTKEHEGKNYPVRQRSTLWVFVDEAPATK